MLWTVQSGRWAAEGIADKRVRTAGRHCEWRKGASVVRRGGRGRRRRVPQKHLGEGGCSMDAKKFPR